MDTTRQLPALRRLARALTADGATADDLVQDTVEAALCHPPATDRPLWPWLAQVLRNRRVSEIRATQRRHAREQDVTPGDIAGSPEQLALARALAAELDELPVDDRQLITMRFWEGLSTVECATQLQRPASTVRTQLHRALTRLRERLDHTRGGREAWMSVLVALGIEPRSVVTRTGMIGSKSLTVGGVCAATIGWLAVAMPNGCEAAFGSSTATPSPTGEQETAPEPPGSPLRVRHRVARDVEPDEAPADAPVPEPPDAEAIPWQAAPASTTAMGVHPQMAVSMALVGLWDSLGSCRPGKGVGKGRFVLTIRFDPDGSTEFERMDFARVKGLSDASLDCIRQSVLARGLDVKKVDPAMLGFGAEVSLEYRLRGELTIDNGTSDFDSVEQQPARVLYFVDKDKPAALAAIETCGPGPIDVEVGFDPKTGAIASARPLGDDADTRRGRCVAAVLMRTVGPARTFEPEDADDGLLRCSFGVPNETEKETRHSCAHVGPLSEWMPRPL